ncbi:hypothetical protein GCT13_45410 [Paraburkholderia sp. CNPSo 3157]|uniref:Uncharacterized protein n=1 Tax=Paraburkholderia franconis TaxID=2654983 RepID=A0A7X1NKV3_9BURK|nr:hypothetical protein [Paraburkholderia franconis]MPW23739.1 hypothetical protein [Paraburkholderia franconis]
MKTVRIEQCNGYEIRMRTILVHDARNMPCAEAPAAAGYAAFAQIARDGEIYVDWHLPQRHRRCGREQAEAQALGYAVRLVERRPFDGPPPDFPEAA